MYFKGRTLARQRSFDANHVDVHTSETFWISGPKRDQNDRRYRNLPVSVDDDVPEEYEAFLRGSAGFR